jgi:hypothetical protein
MAADPALDQGLYHRGARNIILSTTAGEKATMSQMIFSDSAQRKTAFRIDRIAS